MYRHFKFKVGVTVTVIMIMMSVHRDSHWPPHARRPNGGKFSLRHRSRMIIKGCAAIIMMGMMMKGQFDCAMMTDLQMQEAE